MRDGAILLVGGRSARMGSPKTDLDWHGRPLVVHLADVLAAAAPNVVAVAAPDQTLPALPPGVAVVHDAVADDGPLRGLQAGVAAIADTADRVFVASVDLPLLTPAFVRAVLDAIDDAHDAVVPTADGHRHPLAAAYRVDGLASAIDAALDAGERGPMALIARLRTLELDENALRARLGGEATRCLVNVNTPEELDRARATS